MTVNNIIPAMHTSEKACGSKWETNIKKAVHIGF